MNPHHPTVSSPSPAPAHLTAEALAATRLQDRCTARVCYAPTTTPAGERAYGHFTMEADALADTVGRNISPRLQDAESEPAAILTLHRWLRDHDRTDESDEPAAMLPACWPGLEPLIEDLLSAHQARVFCTCCNHNLSAREIRLERTARPVTAVRFRYLCAEGHLLLSLPAAQILAVAEQHAA